MASITAANSLIMLSIAGLFPTPVQLQGYDVDDIYDVENIDNAEIKMGADGNLSAGFIYMAVPQTVTLQADSASNAIFETWFQTEQQAQEKYFADATVTLPATGRVYTCSNGVLSNYSPLPSAKKVLQPRKFRLTWESVVGAPV